MIGEKIQKILEVLMRDRIILTVLNFPAKKYRVNLHWAPICEKNGIVSIGKKYGVTESWGLSCNSNL